MFSQKKKTGIRLAGGVLLMFLSFAVPSEAASLLSALTVHTVIDNADEYPEIADTSFSYEVRAFYGYTRSGNYIYVPDVRATETFSVKNGETRRLFPGGIFETSQSAGWYVPAQRTQTPRDWCFYFMPLSAGTVTDNRLSFTGIETGADAVSYTYQNNGYGCSQPIVCFNYLKATGQNPEVVLHFRYNGKVQDKKSEFDPKLTYSKKIEYLGDGGSAESPRSGRNDYRLYLDAFTDYLVAPEYKRKNIIFVLDCSGSMAYNMSGSKTSNVSKSEQRMTKMKQQAISMIDTLKADPENRYSVIRFSGSGGSECVIRENKVTADRAITAINGLSASGGTNYYSGLSLVNACLEAGETCENVVIFITDGQPTAIPESITGAPSGTDNEYPVALPYAVYEAASLPGDRIHAFYSILINTNRGYGSALQTVSQAVGTAGEKASVMVSSEEELRNVLDAIAYKLVKKPSELLVRDVLSENVAYLGTPVLRAESEDGERILREGTDYHLLADGKVVAATVFAIEPKTRYTLSFDVGASEEAVRKFTAGGVYPDRGDQGTDYDPQKGVRSSGKAGYFSNDEADVTLSWADGSAVYVYGKPVIQVVKPEGITVSVTAQKTLTNIETGKEETPLRAGEFRFRLYAMQEGVKKELGVSANDTEGKIVFDGVFVPDILDHDFYIEEIPGTDSHMVYDRHTARVTVQTGYSPETGELFTRRIDFDDSAPGIFRNGFRYGHARALLLAQKTLFDRNAGAEAPIAAGRFQFVLRNSEKTLLRSYKATNRADGSVIYPELELIEPGTYVGWLSENRAYAHDPRILYDRSEKKVTISVTADDQRDLHAEVSYEDGNRFVNEIWKKDTARVELPGIMKLYGMEWNEGLAGKFEFVLYEEKDGVCGEILAKARNDRYGNLVLEPEFDKFYAYDGLPESEGDPSSEEEDVVTGETGDGSEPEDLYDCVIKQIIPEEGRIAHMVYDTETENHVRIRVRKSAEEDGSLTAEVVEEDREWKKYVNSYSVKSVME